MFIVQKKVATQGVRGQPRRCFDLECGSALLCRFCLSALSIYFSCPDSGASKCSKQDYQIKAAEQGTAALPTKPPGLFDAGVTPQG
jgi:hypothetical protein